jgi:hypothetical protein
MAMAFDYKKEYKEYYLPPMKPTIIEIPEMRFLAVRGSGNPNEEDGEYNRAVSLLYGMAWTLKMSYKGDHKIKGFFEYVVPPLEGFWWQEKVVGVDYSNKGEFQWISIIRLPDFVKEEDFLWAKKVATEKKKMDFTAVEYFTYSEGLCVQCLHLGPFDDEPATVSLMNEFSKGAGYQTDISDKRYHHEIYLIDPRKGGLTNMKTVIRHPVKKVN